MFQICATRYFLFAVVIISQFVHEFSPRSRLMRWNARTKHSSLTTFGQKQNLRASARRTLHSVFRVNALSCKKSAKIREPRLNPHRS